MKKILLSLVLFGVVVILPWCESSVSDTTIEWTVSLVTGAINNNSGAIDQFDVTTGSEFLSEQDKQAILETHPYYKNDYKLRIKEIKVIRNYVAGAMEYYIEGMGVDWSGFWSYEPFLAGKFNGQWIHLYEGNSGDRSCKLITVFWVPRKLLDGCHEIGGEHSIPDKAYQYYIISTIKWSKEIQKNLDIVCFQKYQRTCTKEDIDAMDYTITNDERKTQYYIQFGQTERYIYDIASDTFYSLRASDGYKKQISF